MLLPFSVPEFSKAAQLPRHQGLARKRALCCFFFLPFSSVCPSGTHRLSVLSTSIRIFYPVAGPVSNLGCSEFKQAVIPPHLRQGDCYGLEAQPGLHRKFQANLSYNGLPKHTQQTKRESREFRAIQWCRRQSAQKEAEVTRLFSLPSLSRPSSSLPRRAAGGRGHELPIVRNEVRVSAQVGLDGCSVRLQYPLEQIEASHSVEQFRQGSNRELAPLT